MDASRTNGVDDSAVSVEMPSTEPATTEPEPATTESEPTPAPVPKAPSPIPEGVEVKEVKRSMSTRQDAAPRGEETRDSRRTTSLSVNANGGDEKMERHGSTSRFQVIKTEEAEEDDPAASRLSAASSSALNGPSEKEKLLGGFRKTSMPQLPLVGFKKTNFGRFTAFGRSVQKPSTSAAKPKVQKTESDVGQGGRTVHFGADEKSEKEATPESPTADSPIDASFASTNQKSYRHVQTLERPPIMDYYRNSVNEIGSSARPSIMQLMTGQQGQPADADELQDWQTKSLTVVGMDMSEMDLSRQPANGQNVQSPSPTPRTKFGWIEGVFFRCFLNIVGTILFLRVSWVAAQAGILLGSSIVLLASVVTMITALSTCAICTNGDVKGGGAYFLISRSLGPEFGGSIGLMFSLANAVGSAMCVVGFAETLRDVFREYDMIIIDGGINDIRVIGSVTCAVLIAVMFIGTEFESKMQIFLLIILTLALFDFFIGTFMPTTEEQQLRGITGYAIPTIKENLLPAFRSDYGFFTVFAIYFPATTGIMAGANISGDLADPQRAIPLGTILAIIVTTVIYLATVFVSGGMSVRDADGVNFPQLLNETVEYLVPADVAPAAVEAFSTVPAAFQSYVTPACAYNNTCPFGIMNYFQLMELVSVWGPLITAGIFAATLSSALASLVSAPKIFQAVCKDRLFPYIDVFAKGYGRNEEPRRAYVLAFIITFACTLIGELNLIAPIISAFYLCAYALINYACFDNSFAHSPGFRPGFRFYNMWVSLLGAIICVVVMFIINWITALLTFFSFALLYWYISRRKPDVNWGSSTQAHSYRNAIQGVTKLDHTDEHVKNYRPQILVLTGLPSTRPSLVDFVNNITKGKSLMVCGCVLPCKPSDLAFGTIRTMGENMRCWLRDRRIKSFFDGVACESLREGAQSMMQLSGLGKLRPNILFLGFKRNWADRGPEGMDDLNEYFGVIQDAFLNNMGVAILRNGDIGLDCSELMTKHNLGDPGKLRVPDAHGRCVPATTLDTSLGKRRAASDLTSKLASIAEQAAKHPDEPPALDILNEYMEGEHEEEDGESYEDENYMTAHDETRRLAPNGTTSPHKVHYRKPHASGNGVTSGRSAEEGINTSGVTINIDSETDKRKHQLNSEQKELLHSINRFQRKIKKSFIDVWWLYDDGGLALLIPYLLSQPKSYLEDSKLRVFTISMSATGMEQEQRNMAALLSKFRIGYSDVKVIPDIARKPRKDTIEEFAQIIEPFRWEPAAEGETVPEGLISEAELGAQNARTQRQLRIAEELRENSRESDLVIVSLPVPRKGCVSGALYMAWLEVMTRGLPPTLLVRGNQSSVLTFYS